MNSPVGPSVVPVVHSQVHAVSELLGRAFQGDLLAAYMFPDAQERVRLLPIHFEAVVRYGLLAGRVWTTSDIGGAIVCQPPGQLEMDEQAMAESGIADEALRVGKDNVDRFRGALKLTEALRRRDAGARHWYVMVIGVDPLKKGTGIGSALLKHVSSLADSEQVPCYLETGQPENVSFYQRNGFKVVVEDVEPASGLRFWTFRREPAYKPGRDSLHTFQ